MPNWKKVAVSGSAASFSSLSVDTFVSASTISANQFTGSLFGTASRAISSSFALTASFASTASYIINASISGAITNVDYIDFNTSATVTQPVAGRLSWNNSDGTLDLGMKGGTVVQQIGEETFYEVRNQTGTSIPNGTSLYASGVTAGSGRITAAPFVADGTIQEVRYLGLATEDISDGVNGFVSTFGYVRNLDTRGTAPSSVAVGNENWTVGDILYAHPTVPGKLTNIPPKDKVYVAIVIIRNATAGVLFVRPSSYGHIDDLHDVNINTGSLSSGDLLIYDSGSDYWTNSKQLTGSYGLTGSLEATSFTGSLFGTASQAVSSSYALTASYALNGGGGAAFPYTGSAVITGSLAVTGSQTITGSLSIAGATTVTGSLSIAAATQISGSLRVTGSTIFTGSLGVTGSTSLTGSLSLIGSNFITGSSTITGSFKLIGNNSTTGSVAITGSLGVTGSISVQGGVTGSLFGTASYAVYALSASYAPGGGGASFPYTGSAIISGSLAVTGSTTMTGSLTVTTTGTEFQVLPSGIVVGNTVTDLHNITGSVNISGSLLVNGVAPGGGGSGAGFPFTGSAQITGSLGVTGSVTATSIVETSALRFKENIQDLDSADSLYKLRPVTFDWKTTHKQDIGFIAEEVNEVIPVLAELNESGEAEGVKYSKLTALLTKALQIHERRLGSQQQEIEQLKQEINNLKNK